MQFPKKMNMPTTQQNLTRTMGYEVRTFTTNIRNRSPMANQSNYIRRSPMKKEQRPNDSGYGEMMYIESNDMNYRGEEMSQIQNNYIMRSPINREEVYAPYRQEFDRAQLETSQNIRMNNIGRIPQFNLDMDRRRERLSRSPKTINIGETPAEVEYNMRTVQGRNRSPKVSVANSPMPLDNPMGERSYNMMSETGNIFFDQPLQGSFIRQNEIMGSPNYIQQTSYEMKNNSILDRNNREINYAMNTRTPSWHFTKNVPPC